MYLKIIYLVWSDSLPREILLELWMTFHPESSEETLPNNHIFPEAYRYMNFHFPYLFESWFIRHARRTNGNTKVLWMCAWISKLWLHEFFSKTLCFAKMKTTDRGHQTVKFRFKMFTVLLFFSLREDGL